MTTHTAETIVQKKVWGPGDTYLTVEVQVNESDFKHRDKVKVTIERVSVES